jgi:hypothetical protein
LDDAGFQETRVKRGESVTHLSDDEIRDAVMILKRKATRTAANHLWELIADAEALLAGRMTLLDRDEIEADELSLKE